jgi:hypothetical protein
MFLCLSPLVCIVLIYASLGLLLNVYILLLILLFNILGVRNYLPYYLSTFLSEKTNIV